MEHRSMGRNSGRFWQKIVWALIGLILFELHSYGQVPQSSFPIFERRPFLGNGRIGLIISKDYCFLDSEINIEIGSTCSIPYIDPETKEPFTRPIGYFVLKARNDVISATPTVLHRDKGYAEGSFKTRKGGIQWRLLASQSPGVGLLCLKIEGEEPFPHWQFVSYVLDNEENLLPLKQTEMEGTMLTWQEMPNEGSFTTAWDSVKLDYDSPWDYVIFFTHECAVGEENNEMSNAKVLGRMPNARLRIADNAELDEILSGNELFWHDVYQHSHLSIPDENFSKLYQEALYRFASATFSNGDIVSLNGLLPVNPQTPAWHAVGWGAYSQQTYNFCFRAGLCSFFAPVAQSFLNEENTLARNTDLPRNDVAALTAFTSPKLNAMLHFPSATIPADLDQTKISRYYLLWAMHQYYLYCQYAYSEEELLQRFYPLLQKAVNFCLSELKQDENGLFHVPQKTLQNGIAVADAAAELSLLKWALHLIETIERQTHSATALSETYKTVNARLAPFPFEKGELLPGSGVDWGKYPVTDYEPLLSFYPLQLFSWDVPEHRALITNSVNRLVANLRAKGTENGYLYSACASMFAWMENGDSALSLLKEYLYLYHNTPLHHSDKPGAFSRPMGIANAIQDLCLQNINNLVKIFPALPSEWQNVSFEEWKTQGNISVSASQSNGRFQKAVFRSPHAEDFFMNVQLPAPKNELKCNFPEQATFLKEFDGKTICRLKLSKGKPIVFQRIAP